MIQAAIARMAGNSFVLKGWSVTAASGLLAFAAGTKHPWIAAVALLPSLVFWGLDAQYLTIERRYRALHDAVVAGGEGGPARYSMDTSNYTLANKTPAWRSWSVAPVHSVVSCVVLVVVIYLAFRPDGPPEPTLVKVKDTVIVQPLTPR